MGEREQWQLDGSAPELYQRYLVTAMTAKWATDLVTRAALHPGDSVLDIACGTGVVARAAAERVGVTGRVAALDINPGMLATARSLPAPDGAAIEWTEGNALALPYDDEVFDVVFCQLGLQFLPDRGTALSEARRTLAPSGRLALNVFGPIEHNPATRALSEALDRHVGADASAIKRGEHSLADTDELRALVTAAGFENVEIDTATKMVHFPSVTEYVRIQLAATPLASIVDAYDADRRAHCVKALVDDVEAALAAYAGDEGLSFPQEVHIVFASPRGPYSS
jgi:ubiquinone/menaquinone biosynthesis C-methylase UbiE